VIRKKNNGPISKEPLGTKLDLGILGKWDQLGVLTRSIEAKEWSSVMKDEQ
jgi:hypothetical protein